MSRVLGLVLAAGAGARFGGGGAVAKPLAEVAGRPMVAWPVQALREGGVERVAVVTGATELTVAGAEVVRCADWREGVAASLRSGIAWAQREHGAEAVVIALADQPLLDGRAVAKVLAARGRGATAVRATYGGVPNHPTVIEAALFDALAHLRGDQGARPLLGDATLVPCDGLGAPDDVDTPADLARVDRLRRLA